MESIIDQTAVNCPDCNGTGWYEEQYSAASHRCPCQPLPRPPRVPLSIRDVRALFHVNRNSPVFQSFNELGIDL